MINPVALVQLTENGVAYSTERGCLSCANYVAARELHREDFPEPARYPDIDEQAYFVLGFDEDFFIEPSHIDEIRWLTDA